MRALLASALVATVSAASIALPGHLNYQGRISVQGTNFDGIGQFKFALVSPSLDPAHPELAVPVWSNAGALAPGAEPATSVALPVAHGLYAVRLGDGTVPGMVPFSGLEVFEGPLLLRVWFDDGVHGFQQLTPDQPLGSSPYAMLARRAASVEAGAIGEAQLASGSVSAEKVAAGAITGPALAVGAVGAAQLADGTVTAEKFAAATAPAPGQVLGFNGGGLGWVSPVLALPLATGVASSTAGLSIQNNDVGPAITGVGTGGDGVAGYAQGSTKSALYGQHNGLSGGQGVYGYGFFGAVGVLGVSNQGDGVSGRTNGVGRSGVFGYAEGANSSGLHGSSALHHGLYAYTGSTDRPAIWADAPNGAEAIHGHSNGGDGVVGFTQAGGKAGVFGFTTTAGAVGVAAYSSQHHALTATADQQMTAAIYARNSAALGKGLQVDGTSEFNGAVGISVGHLRVNGGDIFAQNYAWKHGDLTWDVPSDARLKDVQGDYSFGLEEIARIRTVRFTHKVGNPLGLDPGKQHVGVIAQELRDVIPDAVTEGANGYLSIKADSVIWALVNAVKELKSENEQLRARVEALENSGR